MSFLQHLKYEARQFCFQTTLHGYRFIVLPKRILLERIFWVIVVVISLIAALTLLSMAWVSFQLNPTLLVTDSTHYPIWNYPFPAVTICNLNKLSRSRTYELAEKLSKSVNMNVDELAWNLRILCQLIFNDNAQIPARNYTKIQDILDSNNYTAHDVLKVLSPDCNELLKNCIWKGEEKRCESIFEPILTLEGYCCTFNYYALKNHTFAGTLSSKIPKTPRRVSACGYQSALQVLANNNPEDYFAVDKAAVGNQVVIHNAFNFPDWSSQMFFSEAKGISFLGITPERTFSTRHITGVPIKRRGCIFYNESWLHNFANYNFHNCMVECRMNMSVRSCGCIPFYYHNPDGSYPKTRICNLRDVACLRENRDFLLNSHPGLEENKDAKLVPWAYLYSECPCIPDCEYVDYKTESSKGRLTRDFAISFQALYSNMEKVADHNVIRVFFNDLVSTKNRRDVAFSWHTLLAYYGGLLGLFVGFSFVSAVELIYFFTIRLVVDIYKKSRQTCEGDWMKKDASSLEQVKPPPPYKDYEYQTLEVKNLVVPQLYQRQRKMMVS